MRSALHILCIVVLLPYLALAAGFLLFGYAIASGSLLGFLDLLLSEAAWLVSWGGFAIAGAIGLIAVLGLSSRFRWLGAAIVCLLAGTCLVVVIVLSTTAIAFSHLLFLAPCAGSLVGAGWLAATEWPARRPAQNAA